MNQEVVIKKFKAIAESRKLSKKIYDSAVGIYNSREKKLDAEQKELEKQCNHKYADGSSAYEAGYAHGWCKICLKGD